MENSEAYFYEDVVFFRDHPGRAYRVRHASEPEVADFVALYRKKTGCEIEPSAFPAYAVVQRIKPFLHARLIFWCDKDYSSADDEKAAIIFHYLAAKPKTAVEVPLQ